MTEECLGSDWGVFGKECLGSDGGVFGKSSGSDCYLLNSQVLGDTF